MTESEMKQDPYPDVPGGSFVNSDRAPSMTLRDHDGDPVREAVNRAEYWRHVGVGEVDGYHVMVEATVADPQHGTTHCKMRIKVGGEWDTEEHVYLGGSTLATSFDSVLQMDKRFGELCRKHDLAIVVPEDGGRDV